MKRFMIIVAGIAIVSLSFRTSRVLGQEAEGGSAVPAVAASADEDLIRGCSENLVAMYNRGDAKGLAEMFCPDAELVDDAGTIFTGRDEISAAYSKFIEKFPEARMELNIDSLRFAASGIAIEDGTRTVTTADESARATNRYTMVHVKKDGKWLIASAREMAEDPEPTPGERLQPLAWMVGDWVDEHAEATVAISCRWADSGNFLLLDFDARVQGEPLMKSTQRIGWDPLTGRVRSWVFDSDGGYGYGDWVQVDDRWIIKSSAVLPSGVTGSATIIIQPESNDKFTMTGFDRILGNVVERDYEAVIVRKPPQPAK